MDLLKTVLLYMTMVFATSVQNMPEPSQMVIAPTETPYVQATATPTVTPTPKPSPVPTINITPNPEYKTIQMGDNGDRVRELQEKLAAYGYYTGDIDGRFGNQTRRAVESFQYQHGLSADGIAGRRTLTVLYESDEVRYAPQTSATPAPDAAAVTPIPGAVELTAALSSFEPISTAEPAASAAAATPANSHAPTAAPSPIAAPTATPEPKFLPMEGYTIHVNGQTASLQTQLETALLPYRYGDKLYLPLREVLASAGISVISSSSLDQEELALALGNDLIRLSYTENQAGEPIDLRAYRNGEEQILPGRDIRQADGVVYVPDECLESLLALSVTTDEMAQSVLVTIPAVE